MRLRSVAVVVWGGVWGSISFAADVPSSEALAELERVAGEAEARRLRVEESFEAARRDVWKIRQSFRAASAAESQAREQLAAATRSASTATLVTVLGPSAGLAQIRAGCRESLSVARLPRGTFGRQVAERHFRG